MKLQALEISQISQIPEQEIKYLPGHPRQYRFDASRGIINLNGETPVTKKSQAFSFIPIGYRLFKDDILGMGKKKWAEFFFLNKSNQVCNLLVHGYSVEQLMKTIEQMYYDEANLCDVELTLKPIERTNKVAESKYFIADFSYKLLPAGIQRYAPNPHFRTRTLERGNLHRRCRSQSANEFLSACPAGIK